MDGDVAYVKDMIDPQVIVSSDPNLHQRGSWFTVKPGTFS